MKINLIYDNFKKLPKGSFRFIIISTTLGTPIFHKGNSVLTYFKEKSIKLHKKAKSVC